MTDKVAGNQKPNELLVLFIGFFIFFAVSIFIPEEVKTLRITGFLISAIVIITALIMMIKKRKELSKSKSAN